MNTMSAVLARPCETTPPPFGDLRPGCSPGVVSYYGCPAPADRTIVRIAVVDQPLMEEPTMQLAASANEDIAFVDPVVLF